MPARPRQWSPWKWVTQIRVSRSRRRPRAASAAGCPHPGRTGSPRRPSAARSRCGCGSGSAPGSPCRARRARALTSPLLRIWSDPRGAPRMCAGRLDLLAPRGSGGCRGFAAPLPHGLDDGAFCPPRGRADHCRGQRLADSHLTSPIAIQVWTTSFHVYGHVIEFSSGSATDFDHRAETGMPGHLLTWSGGGGSGGEGRVGSGGRRAARARRSPRPDGVVCVLVSRRLGPRRPGSSARSGRGCNNHSGSWSAPGTAAGILGEVVAAERRDLGGDLTLAGPSVPVAVGLDHGHQLRALGAGTQRGRRCGGSRPGRRPPRRGPGGRCQVTGG